MESNSNNSNFKIIDLIGTGGMANIYKARQISLDRTVAIKKLHPHLTQNLNFIARFETEAKAAASLKHENIVSIIEYGRDSEDYFIAMEYVDGKNLKDILEEHKKVPPEVALVIAREIASGLRYAHEMGLVHRDVKPANIMLAFEGSVKITDFGIVKASKDISLTTTGSTLGSPAYMSPEHLRGTDLDKRSDLFSLGIILFEMLTGQKPFFGENYQEVITRILTENPPKPSKINPEIDPRLEFILKKVLEKDKERRFQDAEELIEELDKQISWYKVSPKKKIIRDYLENPLVFTQRLQELRVKNHLDSALYYLNLGKGRITDAKKEFMEVLRWDKDNEIAQKYLNKLQAEYDTSIQFQNLKAKIFPKNALTTYVLLAVMVILLGFYLWSNGHLQKLFSKSKSSLSLSNPPAELSLPSGNVAFWKNSSFWVKDSYSPNITTTISGNFGYLVVSAKPSAKVNIKGKLYSVPPPVTLKLPAGKYDLKFSAAGYKTKQKKVTVKKDKTVVVEEELKKR
ncbi:MAG: hypothetical protein A2145_00120 [candidate division Zixibacteria bacterium RBG_16_40_9]|nr:MAG: hypothetical protein A2145_00120 [candidate division Zixibacteria bacterium RBG_16_40_9]